MQLKESVREKNKTLQKLYAMNPLEWNNIPIPLTDAAVQLIKSVQSMSNIQTQMEAFLNDLCLVSNNVLVYAEASCDDMRERVTHRVSLLNDKTEVEVNALSKNMEKYTQDQITENNWQM